MMLRVAVLARFVLGSAVALSTASAFPVLASPALVLRPSSPAVSSLAAVVVPTFQNTTTSTATLPAPIRPLVDAGIIQFPNKDVLVERSKKSIAVLSATVATFLLKSSSHSMGGGMSAIQASSWVGLVAALTSTAPTAAFCGSFAGMSAQISNLGQATVLGGLAAAVFYWWDARGIGVGKGGRLGTVAFLGNLLLCCGRGGIVPLLQQTGQLLGPLTAFTMALSASTLQLTRRRAAPLTTSVDETTKSNNNNNSRGLVVAQNVSKAVLLAVAASRLFTSTTTAVADVLQSVVAMTVAAVTVQKSNGVVLPVALVGLLGSLTPLAAPIYLGAFVGMTGLQDFKLSNTVQACTLSALLLHLGVLDGFGGKLGFLSFVGVLFGR